MTIRLACHVGIGPAVEGVALVADDNFSARYDLDRIKGVFSRPQHKLHGQSYRDVILVLNTAKGGVATAWMLHEMACLLYTSPSPRDRQNSSFAGSA